MIHSNNKEKFYFEINKDQYNLFYFYLKDEEGNIYLKRGLYTQKTSCQEVIKSVIKNSKNEEHFIIKQDYNDLWIVFMEDGNGIIIAYSQYFNTEEEAKNFIKNLNYLSFETPVVDNTKMKNINNIYRPIDFSTPMIQAILEGRKTQTRRIIKPQPTKQWAVELWTKYLSGITEEEVTSKDLDDANVEFDNLLEDNPIKKGVILWVREKWQYSDDLEEPYLYEQKYNSDYLEEYHNLIKWKSSTHMPKEAARTFLKVTNVWLERLQDITEEEAMQEGIERFYEGYGGPSAGFLYNDYCRGRQFHLSSAKKGFQSLWQSIYGIESWDENPWVWVYSFEWIDKPKDWKY